MAEFSFRAIGDDLNVMMGMKRPDSTRSEGIIIEDPECPKWHVVGIVVVTKGEVPAALEGAVHYSPDLIDTSGWPDNQLGLVYGCFMIDIGISPVYNEITYSLTPDASCSYKPRRFEFLNLEKSLYLVSSVWPVYPAEIVILLIGGALLVGGHQTSFFRARLTKSGIG